MTAALPISPLQLDTLTRDLWGSYDAVAIAQLAPLNYEACYRPKFYKVPATDQESFGAYDDKDSGLAVTPGSLIYGFYLPGLLSTSLPGKFNFQLKDLSLDRDFWDDPIPSAFIANLKPTYLSQLAYPTAGTAGSFPHLLNCPWPVVGTGLFKSHIWETSGSAQRIEVVIGVLEVIG